MVTYQAWGDCDLGKPSRFRMRDSVSRVHDDSDAGMNRLKKRMFTTKRHLPERHPLGAVLTGDTTVGLPSCLRV